jgi:hypothetical protein
VVGRALLKNRSKCLIEGISSSGGGGGAVCGNKTGFYVLKESKGNPAIKCLQSNSDIVYCKRYRMKNMMKIVEVVQITFCNLTYLRRHTQERQSISNK